MVFSTVLSASYVGSFCLFFFFKFFYKYCFILFENVRLNMVLKWQIFSLLTILNGVCLVSTQRISHLNHLKRATTPRYGLTRIKMPWQVKETKQRTSCTQSNGLIPNTVDPNSYKLCVSKGGNWVVYSYKCPAKTYFNENIKRCVSGTAPNSIMTSTETIVSDTFTKTTESPGSIATHQVSNGPSLASGVFNNVSSSSSTTTDFETTTPTSTDSSSSSSEEAKEIFLTLPPHFTGRPPHPPSLITGQLSIPSLSEKYQLHGHSSTFSPLSTLHEALTSGDSIINETKKLTTWQSLNAISTSTIATPVQTTTMDRNTNIGNKNKLTNPLEFHRPLNKFDEKLLHNLITDQQATRRPTRWRPNIIPASSFPNRERFPSMRPSLRS